MVFGAPQVAAPILESKNIIIAHYIYILGTTVQCCSDCKNTKTNIQSIQPLVARGVSNMLQGCQFATQKVTRNIGTWWHGHFFSKIIIRYHDHRPRFDHFPTKPRNSDGTAAQRNTEQKTHWLEQWNLWLHVVVDTYPLENQDIPTENWWDRKMIHFLLKWLRSRVYPRKLTWIPKMMLWKG